MPDYKYLIVGGGMTADAAVTAIRDGDSGGNIAIISAETDMPYNRPPLTKALWKGESLDSIWRRTGKKGVDFHLSRNVTKIEPDRKRVIDDQGNVYTFDKLLLATGGRPRRLPFGDDRVIYFRTLADYRRLRALTEYNKRFAVIGSGFIGSEIAAALAMNGKDVVMIFPGVGICQRVFPTELCQFVTNYYR